MCFFLQPQNLPVDREMLKAQLQFGRMGDLLEFKLDLIPQQILETNARIPSFYRQPWKMIVYVVTQHHFYLQLSSYIFFNIHLNQKNKANRSDIQYLWLYITPYMQTRLKSSLEEAIADPDCRYGVKKLRNAN